MHPAREMCPQASHRMKLTLDLTFARIFLRKKPLGRTASLSSGDLMLLAARYSPL